MTGLMVWDSDMKMKIKTAADNLMPAAVPVLMCKKNGKLRIQGKLHIAVNLTFFAYFTAKV